MASHPQNKFRLRTCGSQVIIKQVEDTNATVALNSPINVTCKKNRTTFRVNGFDDFNQFFNEFNTDILLMNTTEKNFDTIFCACEQLILNFETLIKNITPDDLKVEIADILALGTKFVVEKLKLRNTAKKRQNLIEKDVCYVMPQEYGLGLTWKSANSCGVDLVNHKLQQTTFQYISIIETIQSLFKIDSFNRNYFEYNENRKHVCTEGVYTDFCCGSIYRENPVFTPTTIQLQLGIDEFEPCDAVKSKAGLHKMCGIYFEIRNIDPNLKSKLTNIYLITIVKSKDLKSDDNNYFDNIANKIVEELKILETIGITLDCNVRLNGVLVNISADNLGANGVFGFVECFAATYFCRICELTSTECKTAVEEVKNKMRRKTDYTSTVRNLIESDSNVVDFKETKGIKKSCAFNKLQFFHILENCCVDVMHDFNEGIIPFFINGILKYIVDQKITTLDDLHSLIRDHNYGWFWKKYSPSTHKITTKAKQNAMQNYCLLLHLPFILNKFKTKLVPAWCAMECLLQAVQILHSTGIRECDIDRLRSVLKEHLKYLIETGANLLPKHHLSTHYPNLISKIGPLYHLSMMRFECKHKMFTDLVRLTNNYKNLPYTLAKRHQARVCLNKNRAFNVNTEISKTSYLISKCADFEKYESHLIPLINNDQIRANKFVRRGLLEYRERLMLIEGKNVFEIIHVICHNSKNFVLCKGYKVTQFHKELNSIEIELIQDSYKLLDTSELRGYKTYDRTFLNDKMFIIADTLDVYNEF